MNRERFVAYQLRELDDVFSLTTGEDENQKRFEQLAYETYDFLISQGVRAILSFDPWPESAGNFLKHRYPNVDVPQSLLRRWKDWNEEYHEIAARNPRLALRDAMQNISESHDASSWPDGYEHRIQAWIDAGDPAAKPPFDDRRSIVTPAFYQKLCELRRRCGGWLYWNDTLRRVVFAPEPDWQQVRMVQEAASAERRKFWEHVRARSEHMAMRLTAVMTIAREDSAFWNSLKNWELAREAKRPAVLPKPESLTGPVRLVQVPPERRNQTDNPPVDAIFAEFIGRVGVPDDVLTTGRIVLNLRAAVRDELGLDGLLVWRDGPGIGEAGS